MDDDDEPVSLVETKGPTETFQEWSENFMEKFLKQKKKDKTGVLTKFNALEKSKKKQLNLLSDRHALNVWDENYDSLDYKKLPRPKTYFDEILTKKTSFSAEILDKCLQLDDIIDEYYYIQLDCHNIPASIRRPTIVELPEDIVEEFTALTMSYLLNNDFEIPSNFTYSIRVAEYVVAYLTKLSLPKRAKILAKHSSKGDQQNLFIQLSSEASGGIINLKNQFVKEEWTLIKDVYCELIKTGIIGTKKLYDIVLNLSTGFHPDFSRDFDKSVETTKTFAVFKMADLLLNLFHYFYLKKFKSRFSVSMM